MTTVTGKKVILKNLQNEYLIPYTEGGGGSGNPDGQTITFNSSNELQTVAVKDNQSGSPIKTWTGTKEQYEAIAEKDPYTLYNITDDVSTIITDINGKANITLDNLSDKGHAKLQYAPFSINNGTVTNGENATLHLPSGSQSDIEVEFIQPVLSANGTVGGDEFAVFASSENGVRAAYKAFNADTGYGATDSWDPYPQTVPCYIGWYNPNPLKMESLTIRNSTTDSQYSYWVRSGELQYSNDNINWFTEQTFTNTVSGNGAYWTINVDNPVLSKYKRLYITAAGSNNRPIIANIQFNNAAELATVEAGTTLVCDSCTITTADGRSKSFNGSSTIDITGVSDGQYKVFKDITDGSLSLSELIISNKEPMAISGDLWLDTSEAPLSLKLYNGTLWTVSNDRVYLGDITIEQGVITEIENTEFNKNTNLVNSSTIANYAMPSNKYIDLTLSASGSTYVAPANGWFYVNKIAGADWHYVIITNTSKVSTGYSDWRSDYRTSPLTPMLPVQKGDVVEITYNATGATQAFKFIYAEGELHQ